MKLSLLRRRRGAPQSAPQSAPKIFCIGLNKTGTTSLAHLLMGSNIPTADYRAKDRPNIARTMYLNLGLGRPLLTGYEDFTAFSDMTFLTATVYLDGHRLFRQLDAEHPDSLMILTTRSKDRWLASRAAHVPPKGPSLLDRFMRLTGEDEAGVRALWSAQWDRHHDEVRAHFKDQPQRLLEFDIEADAPERIERFLAPWYRIDLAAWGHHNATSARQPRPNP